MTTSFASEPTTIGLSDKTHASLKRLAEDKRNGHFAEMADAYRFGIGLALAHGVVPGELQPPRTTIFNVGTLDPDKASNKYRSPALAQCEELDLNEGGNAPRAPSVRRTSPGFRVAISSKTLVSGRQNPT